MSDATSPPAGLLDSARLFGRQLIATVRDRVTLLSVELQEEKVRLTQMFVWASLTVFAAMMTLTFASLLLVYLYWDSARLALLAGFVLFYGGATIALVLACQRFLRRQPAPLAATLAELEADAQCIPPPS
jgi:uncharacterized membrane protein YqjE